MCVCKGRTVLSDVAPPPTTPHHAATRKQSKSEPRASTKQWIHLHPDRLVSSYYFPGRDGWSTFANHSEVWVALRRKNVSAINIFICIFWLIILLKYRILPAIRAAIFIQKWYRQHQARQEMRKRCNWQIFQNLEYASEQDQSEVMNFDISKVERQLLRERFSYSYTSSSVTLWSTCHKLLGLETRQRSVRSHVWHFNRLCCFILPCN